MSRTVARNGIVFLKSCLIATGLLAGGFLARADAQQPAAPAVAPAPAYDPATVILAPPQLDPCLLPATPGDGLFVTEPVRRPLEWLPNGLLWEPLIASKREPRFSALASTHEDSLGDEIADTYLGGTYGVFRYSPAGRPFEIQMDLFGVVISRWSEQNYLVAADYRAGVPITFRRCNWAGKIAWEHTSTHIGDETIQRTGVQRIEYKREEVVAALGYVFDDWVRVYGQFAWAFSQNIDGDPDPYRYDVGFELFNRTGSSRWGQPFGAFNVEFDGDADYEPNYTFQAGWMWRKPDQRLGQVRVFAEYYSGHSFYGQLYRNKENAWAVGISLDY